VRRTAIQDIVNEAAAYGWMQATQHGMNFMKFEPPIIEWAEDGSVNVRSSDGSVVHQISADGVHKVSYLTAIRQMQERSTKGSS
jgi:hypothetical protein